MQAIDLSIGDINEAKAKPAYLRGRAEEFIECGMPATAGDYREAANTIEMLLAALGLPSFVDDAAAILQHGDTQQAREARDEAEDEADWAPND